MASEMINKVLDAENKAAEREADAKAKAADIIKTAEAEAKAATDAEKKAALEESDRVVAEARKATGSLQKQNFRRKQSMPRPEKKFRVRSRT